MLDARYKGLSVGDIFEIKRVRFPQSEPFELHRIETAGDRVIDGILEQVRRDRYKVMHDTEMAIICEMAIKYLESLAKSRGEATEWE